MKQQEQYSLLRSFSVALSELLDENEGICISLNKDKNDNLFSDSDLIVYKLDGIISVVKSDLPNFEHGKKVKVKQ